jgi:CheY-like chemotaxis protein
MATWGLVIIAVSGYGDEQARRQSGEAGCDPHLLRPVDVDHLLTVIADCDVKG